jgi:hypothetical protein
MIYKMLPRQEGEPQIYARIDDDGLCRLTCTAQHQPMLDDLASGVTLLDAEGVEMTPEQVQAFFKDLA